MKKIQIDVTQEDIDNAPGFTCNSCPIFMAIQRHPELKDYVVGESELFSSAWLKKEIPLPRSAKSFARKVYANKGAMGLLPFDFEINLDL